MDRDEQGIGRALDFLAENYPDPNANSNKVVSGSRDHPHIVSGESYRQFGMKQSKFSHVIYRSCRFENVALTGSQFRTVTFQSSDLVGSSFAYCDFYDSEFDGSGCEPYSADNFSLSNFEQCRFMNLHLLSSGMLGSLFHRCAFRDVTFKSSTLEGTGFVACDMVGCDFGNVNVEFTRFFRTKTEHTYFPFYQFPYVIGAAEYLRQRENGIALRIGERIVPMAEYCEQLERLTLYFLDKHEWFPACNLCIALNDLDQAKQHLMAGISVALDHRDFRMVRYFCQLALQHEILDEVTRRRILCDMDSFLLSKDIPDTQLNYYMTHIGSIRTLLYGGGSDTVALHFNISTNVSRSQVGGVAYVNELLSELNQGLAEANGQTGFQVMVSNYSPYDIFISVLSTIGNAASIASLVWQIISAVQDKKKDQRLVRVDEEVYRDYVGAKIDCLRADLLRLQKEYSQRRFSRYIVDVTQQLKTDLEELYTKDIMIFKVENDPKGKPRP